LYIGNTDGTSSTLLRRDTRSPIPLKSYVVPLALYGGFYYANFYKKKNSTKDSGVSVHKLSLAFDITNRDDPNSILQTLTKISSTTKTDSRQSVQQMVSKVCLELMRQQSTIFAVSNGSEYFGNAVEAEKSFNTLSIRERSKFETETVSNFGGMIDVVKDDDDDDDDDESSSSSNDEPLSTTTEWSSSSTTTSTTASTCAIVTLILSIEGSNTTTNTKKGLSKMIAWQHVWDGLSRIGADMMVDDCLLGAEVLWTPEKRGDVVTRRDIVVDYPDLWII